MRRPRGSMAPPGARRHPRGSPASPGPPRNPRGPPAPPATPSPDWTIIDSCLSMLISISTGYNWACWFFEGICDGWQFSWQLQLSLCYSSWLLRKHVPLPVVGVPLEHAFSLATALLPAPSLRWLCPDLWMALLLIFRLGPVLPQLLAARLTELRTATMQSYPQQWQPGQRIVTTVVTI